MPHVLGAPERDRVRVAGLRHEAVDDAVEGDAVVEVVEGEEDEGVAGDGRRAGLQVHDDAPDVRVEHADVVFRAIDDLIGLGEGVLRLIGEERHQAVAGGEVGPRVGAGVRAAVVRRRRGRRAGEERDDGESKEEVACAHGGQSTRGWEKGEEDGRPPAAAGR